MDILDKVLDSLDSILNSQRKKHIIGGLLLSTSMLFGGLAVTVITIKSEDE